MVSTNIFSSLFLGIGINLDIVSILNYIIIIILFIFKLCFFLFSWIVSFISKLLRSPKLQVLKQIVKLTILSDPVKS